MSSSLSETFGPKYTKKWTAHVEFVDQPSAMFEFVFDLFRFGTMAI